MIEGVDIKARQRSCVISNMIRIDRERNAGHGVNTTEGCHILIKN